MNPHNQALRRGRHELAVLGKHVHAPVGKAAVDAVDLDVTEDPIRRHDVAEANGIVEAVAACIHAESIANPGGDKVGDHTKCGGIDRQVIFKPRFV